MRVFIKIQFRPLKVVLRFFVHRNFFIIKVEILNILEKHGSSIKMGIVYTIY
jgi:hypothetical protein